MREPRPLRQTRLPADTDICFPGPRPFDIIEVVEGALPSGRVTFAFTDVVGSTRAFSEHGDSFVLALQALHHRQRTVAAAYDRVVVSTDGDGSFLAFSRAVDAVGCLI